VSSVSTGSVSDDDFFELGGDSLQAARIAARATAEWKLSIAARTLLEAPTVASMAKTVVAALVRSGRDEEEPPRVRARSALTHGRGDLLARPPAICCPAHSHPCIRPARGAQ
jgi:hypothetical protein